MKRVFNIAVIGMAAALLAACTPSDIKASQSMEIPEGAILETGTRETWTMPESSQYTIPAEAETFYAKNMPKAVELEAAAAFAAGRLSPVAAEPRPTVGAAEAEPLEREADEREDDRPRRRDAPIADEIRRGHADRRRDQNPVQDVLRRFELHACFLLLRCMQIIFCVDLKKPAKDQKSEK